MWEEEKSLLSKFMKNMLTRKNTKYSRESIQQFFFFKKQKKLSDVDRQKKRLFSRGGKTKSMQPTQTIHTLTIHTGIKLGNQIDKNVHLDSMHPLQQSFLLGYDISLLIL